MKKRILFILLMLTVMVSFSACGTKAKDDKADKGTATKEQVLKIAGLNGGYKDEHWKELVKKFEAANPGVKVELKLEKNIAEVLRPQLQAGDYPDIIYLSIGSEGKLTDTLVKEKALADITDVMDMKVPGEEKTVKEKIIPGFLDTYFTKPYEDGKTYLAPLFYGPCGLFYNQANFGEGKYEFPKTFADMFKLGEKIKAEGTDKALFTYPTTGYFDAFFYALLNEVGGPELFNKAMHYDPAAWSSPEATKAFEIVGELAKYTNKNTVSQANKEGFTKNQQMILDNKAMFVPNGTWLPGEMKDAPRAEGFKWGFSALPKVEANGDQYSYTFFEQMFIPKKAKNPDLAKKFMAYMYSDEAAKIIYEKAKAVQPIVGASSFMKEDDPNKLFYTIYDNGVKPAMGGFASAKPVEGVDLTSAEGILFGSVNAVVNGDLSVKDWQAKVVEAAKKIHEANK